MLELCSHIVMPKVKLDLCRLKKIFSIKLKNTNKIRFNFVDWSGLLFYDLPKNTSSEFFIG